LAVTALRKSVSDIDYGFGDAYDPEKNSKKLSYNKLADILGNKANELNAVKYGAASTIPGLAHGYEEIRNSPMMHEVNNFYMVPAVSQIANGYNPIDAEELSRLLQSWRCRRNSGTDSAELCSIESAWRSGRGFVYS
jgi:hypothetical protein